MSRASRPIPSILSRTVADAGQRGFRFWRGSLTRFASRFSSAFRSSKTSRSVQVHSADSDSDLTLLDEMAQMSATPLGVDDETVPVGLEGLKQDWGRVGQLLQNAMGVVSIKELEDSDTGQEKDL